MQFTQGALGCIVGIRHDCGLHFIDYVEKFTVRAENDVPGTRTGRRFHDLWVGAKRSFCRVETVNQQFIEAEIGDYRESIIRRHCNRVGVRTFLALRIYAVTFMLHERSSLAKASIF